MHFHLEKKADIHRVFLNRRSPIIMYFTEVVSVGSLDSSTLFR